MEPSFLLKADITTTPGFKTKARILFIWFLVIVFFYLILVVLSQLSGKIGQQDFFAESAAHQFICSKKIVENILNVELSLRRSWNDVYVMLSRLPLKLCVFKNSLHQS